LTLTSKKRVLNRARMLDFLEKLAIAPGEDLITLYLTPRLPTSELENFLKEIPAPQDISGLSDIINRSSTGAVIFWSAMQKYIVIPPFPVAEKSVKRSLDIQPLRSALNREYLVGLVLVRLGSYAIGVGHGEKLVSSKVGTGLVHGRHRQGGSSAHRFERHRDKQIEYFLTRVCQHAREQLEPYVKSLDYIVYGGARTTILLLQKQCPLLGKLETPLLPPLLDIPEPRQVVLETALNRIWLSTVYEWLETK
jgi:hypothetical protein